MDNDLQELEAELKRLRPVAASRALTEEISRQLAARPRRHVWAWAALPLAAMVAGMFLLQERPIVPAAAVTVVLAGRPSANVPTTAAYKPVSTENLLYDQSDEGLVTLADGTPARRTRRSYVDTITWRNPNTQASLKWSVPRTEERVIPVSFQ